MPTFPAITPSSRTFTPGSYPSSPFMVLSGEQSAVRHSDAVLDATLELEFIRLTEAERLSIEDHYLGQYGEMEPFMLPPQAFSGFNAYDFNEGAGWWRYAEPLEIEDFCGPHHDVRVRLVSAMGVGAAGAQLRPITTTISGGDAYPAQSGLAGTVTVTLAAGAATATNPAGPLLLLHMEGTGTTIVDSSSAPKTLTVSGASGLTQSTTQSKFGSKALFFPDAGGSWVTATTFAISGGSIGSTVGAVTVQMFFWLSSAASSASTTWLFTSNNTDLRAYCLGATLYMSGSSVGSIATETWHYIKITRGTNGLIRRFFNGTEYFTPSTRYNYGSVTNLRLGNDASEDSISMRGYIDEVVMTPEADNSLTVPTTAYPDP